MSKTAYISIEGTEAKVYIGEGKTLEEKNFYHFELKDLPEFIRKKSIKDVIISQFFPNLITFKFNLPLAKNTLKKKKILDGIVMGEIRKRYPALKNFSFTYKVYERAGGAYVRCYLLDEENFDTVNNLILQGINIKAFYPFIFPIMEMVKSKQEKKDFGQIICLFSGFLRFIFVLRGDELILQRSFEGSEENLTDEDILNINMTASYSLQNMRVKPERAVFIGVKAQEIKGLTIPFEFIDFPENTYQYAVPLCLFKFEKQLRGKEFFLTEYRKYLSNKKYINYALILLLVSAMLLFLYNFYLLREINSYRNIFSSYRNEIALKERDFFALQEQINYFEKNLKPFIELQNKKNTAYDIKASIYPVSEASKIKQVEINSIDIENKIPQKLKISGKISGVSFTERQTAYTNFKNIIIEKGIKIYNEKWDFTKGEFTLEGEYDSQRVLQK